MPRYFFHVKDGTALPDNDGLELRDSDEARAEAVIAAGEAPRDAGPRFWRHGEWQMVVTSDTGETVCTLRFSGG